MTRHSEEPKRSLPTSRDVARKAGVSRALVSYVLNGTRSAHVSAETRARVLAAVEELGYHPSSSARTLRRGRSDEIAVALGHGPFFVDVLRAMEDRATQLGYILTPYLLGEAAPQRRAMLGRRLFERRPAGIVTFPSLIGPDEMERARRLWDLTWVYIALKPVDEAPTICLRLVDAGDLAAQHLLKRGHRRLALIVPTHSTSLPDDSASPPPRSRLHVDLRLAGMRRAMGRYAQTTHATLTRVPMQPSLEGARRIVDAWLRDDERPTGVYGFNDECAFLLLAALHEQGVRIPGEIAVVGTDDTSFCQLSYPTLTSIQYDPLGIGERAIDMIDVLSKGEPLPPHLSVCPSPRLIHRGSS